MTAEVAGRNVLVTGAATSGRSAAALLRAHGAQVTLVDAKEAPGALVDNGDVPSGTDLVVTSPGWRPDAAVLRAAHNLDLEVWGEVELAWRLRPASQAWLAITGTNGKTTATGMLTEILAAAGLRSTGAGNIGVPLTEVVAVRPAYEVLAVELSSFQLHWSQTLAPYAAAVINIAADHVDWHGSTRAYARAKAKVFGPGTIAVFNADDHGASAVTAGRPGAVGVTRASPARGMLGVKDGQLFDAAFGGGNLVATADLQVTGPHNVTDALIAAALARAYDTDPAAVAAGLRSYTPGPHRMRLVATHHGVSYVDDSKGTNPHAAAAALDAYPDAVWIAGGLAKGASFDALIIEHAQALRGAVLIGTCARQIARALARHAAQIPVFHAGDLDNAVRTATRLAGATGTVLLSPAAASMDMFKNYQDRGERFAQAVHALAGPPTPTTNGD